MSPVERPPARPPTRSDPFRVTPQQWLDASAGEDPAITVADLRSLLETEGPALAGRLAAGTEDQVRGP